jgi:hypothetical protein
MKKYLSIGLVMMIVVLGMLVASAVNATVVPTTIIFTDNFGTGSTVTPVPGWTDGGNSGDDSEARAVGSGNDSASPDGGRFAVMFGQDGYICQTINATGYTSVQVSYYWRGDGDADSSTDNALVES